MADISRLDRQPGSESPLAAAVTARDKETLAMVRQAVQDKRMRLAYQPIVLAADSSRVAFYEGLMRVIDTTGRVIPARDFIHAIETDELGREIDCLALNIGLTALARFPQVRLSVNMSARSVGYPRWMKILRKGLAADKTIGERLILEISESSAMLIPELVVAFMDDLQNQGVCFALDDFGAGQTTFRHFRNFFFDMVKIDGQFIRNIHSDPDNQALTRALMAIGQNLDMLTIAASVETKEDAEWLQSAGIDCMQGFLFGAPTVRPSWAEGRAAQAG
ncbi:EAL domain-containing protein [Pseudorhodobacter sp. E13]|uniref:EAL domain-containing protein n=1 Tax=Pseudorhodobacter sp. E13 TaxID=2487931 RepID=UPI000F8F1953|nr:EAL domain-containing protein [Pseudorhodobacter sp. E13]RUS59026.1 EAL domain-containing protein [Pseudorhodobacter sp. E13]